MKMWPNQWPRGVCLHVVLMHSSVCVLCCCSMFMYVCPQMTDKCNVPGSHALLKGSVCFSAKRQLGQKTATTSRLSAWLIACTEACVALTDGWGGGWGGGWCCGVGWVADAGCVRYTVNPSLRPITLIQNLHLHDAATSHFVSNEGLKKRCFLLKIITVQAELWCTASYHQTIVYIKLGQWIQVLLLYVSTSVGSLSGCLCFVYAIIFPWGNCGSWKWSGSSKLFPMALPSVYECTVCMNGWA